MNRTDISTAARSITDLDESDVPQTLINMWVKDGYDRIIALERRWPFFEVSATLTTVASQRDYPILAISDGRLREITSLRDATGGQRLSLISFDDGEEVWAGNDQAVGRPVYYSTWGAAINLWPTPQSVITLLLRGYRRPTDWHISDTLAVDADERLHQSLVYFTVAQMYQLQEDVDLAGSYMNQFENSAKLAQTDIMRGPSAVPLILSGGGATRL